MSQYVILRHEGSAEHKPGVHWDLMLEWGGTLRTWALAEEPIPGRSIAAEALPEHRLLYLDYEGPISGNRGTVTRWDAGEFELVSESSLSLAVTLCGDRLHGLVTLERLSDSSRDWRFVQAAPGPS